MSGLPRTIPDMACNDEAFLKTQIGRGLVLHYEPPEGTRRKSVVKHGLLMNVMEGRLVVQLFGEEHPVHIEGDADQPAFADRDRDGSVWWEFTGAPRSVDSA